MNNDLGSLKEHYFIEWAIFLAPKCYIFVLKNDTVIFKFKGINELSFKKKFDTPKKLINIYLKLYESINLAAASDLNKNLSIDLNIISIKNSGDLNAIEAESIYTPKFQDNKRLKVFKNYT